MFVMALIVYISFSTTFISEPAYLKRAWEEVDHNPHILNWQEGEVSVAPLQDRRIQELFIPKPTSLAKLNRSLLWVNGNQAVRVLFHTDHEGLLGPITVYFNPVTKQVFGYDVNE